jgi:Ca2+-binding EF-hand superfamily protein
MTRKLLPLALMAAVLAGCGAPAPQPLTSHSQPQTLSARDLNLVKSAIKQAVSREFTKLDKNQDKRLSKQELSKKSPLFLVLFQTVDLDMDGYVTYDEFLNRMANNMEVVSRLLFAFMDSNDDGQVTSADLSKFLIALFDANNDRNVSFDEFQRFITSPSMINTPW